MSSLSKMELWLAWCMGSQGMPAVAWDEGQRFIIRFPVMEFIVTFERLDPQLFLFNGGVNVPDDMCPTKGLTRETFVVGVPDRETGADDRWKGCRRFRCAWNRLS